MGPIQIIVMLALSSGDTWSGTLTSKTFTNVPECTAYLDTQEFKSDFNGLLAEIYREHGPVKFTFEIKCEEHKGVRASTATRQAG
jgi:hypothetical protein